MMVSLVAGAAGFLGSNLSNALLGMGHKVIGFDNLSTSTGANLQQPLMNSNFEFHECSVSDDSTWPLLPKVDYIFHFASPASPPKYQKLGLETIKANTLGTENLIKFALKNHARLIFASTSEVYGDPLVTPQPESYWGNVNPNGTRSVYDESKRLGETLVSHYMRENNLDAVIIRIFNTYGPGMDPFDGRVVSSFIRQGLLGEPFSVFGDGLQTRSFCFVDDLVSGIVSVSRSSESGPINLGNPNEITLLELGDRVAKALGIDPNFAFYDLPEDDPKQRCPDISLARERLDWEPTVTIEEGIERTALWMQDFKDAI
jgi:dTDP-glucose 4,6-dehydratase